MRVRRRDNVEYNSTFSAGVYSRYVRHYISSRCLTQPFYRLIRQISYKYSTQPRRCARGFLQWLRSRINFFFLMEFISYAIKRCICYAFHICLRRYKISADEQILSVVEIYKYLLIFIIASIFDQSKWSTYKINFFKKFFKKGFFLRTSMKERE